MENSFVSRGGLKLQAALTSFNISPDQQVVLDVGSSTGGFVDCLLQHGAAKVYSVDTAYGELAWKLRNDPRVVVLERTNILHLPSLTGFNPKSDSNNDRQPKAGGVKVDLITIDAGWTKLELVLPAIRKFLKPGGQIIALLKPHYQTDRPNLVKGVVKANKLPEILDTVTTNIKNLKFEINNLTESPILGGGGNKEYLLLLSPSP